jgi:hypothetical protein
MTTRRTATVICDFCSSPRPRWSYPCPDFTVQGYGSEGDWAACDECSLLVEADDREALALRSAEQYVALHGLVSAGASVMIAETLVDFQRLFFEHKTGERQAWG